MVVVMSWRRLPPPGFIGGAEIADGLWAALLASIGIEVYFLGSAENPRNHRETSMPWLEQLLALDGIVPRNDGSRLEYEWRGVRCTCVPQNELLAATERALLTVKPDLLWTEQEGCDRIAALAGAVPIVSYVHSVSSVGLLSAALRPKFLLSPSRFVQEVVRSATGLHSHLIRGVLQEVDLPAAGSSNTDRSTVLFVNPIPEKGVDVALSIATYMPDTQFVFVEAWRAVTFGSDFLPKNVLHLPRQPNLAAEYARARLVIAPSIIPDAGPRVVSEAGNQGIPVLGSTSGGIPELVANPQANCIPVSDLSTWRTRAYELLHNDAAWHQASIEQQSLTRSLFRDPLSSLVDAGVVAPPSWLHGLA